jgi:hypothetical protein
MVKNALYWALPSGEFLKKSAYLAIVTENRFVQRFLREALIKSPDMG